MAQTQVKRYQLQLGTDDNILGLRNVDIAANAAIVSTKLAEGAEFIRRNGSVSFTADQSMGGNRLTNVGAPVQGTDAIRLIDLQNNQAGLVGKDSVKVATVGGISLAGTQTIDGVSVTAGDRVLVKNQDLSSENGIYVVAAGAWSRALDADTGDELLSAFVFVEEGNVNSDSGWLQTANSPITINTTPISWVQFSGGGQIIAGAGLTKTGNQIDIGTASSSRIVVNADNIDLATVVTGGGPTGNGNTIPVISWDAYGRITAVSTATITPATIGAQSLDADLTAIASLVGTGIAVRTASDTWTLRSIAVGASGLSISNSDGVGGNPTVGLANDLLALESLASTGFAVRTGTDTWAQRSILGTSGRIIVTDGNGINDNPAIDLATISVGGAGPAVSNVDSCGRVTALRALTTGDMPSGTINISNRVTRETPSGTVNGVNTSYTLANAPIAGTEEIYLNGVQQEPGIGNDYSISGSAISFIYPPQSGDKIRVSYFK